MLIGDGESGEVKRRMEKSLFYRQILISMMSLIVVDKQELVLIVQYVQYITKYCTTAIEMMPLMNRQKFQSDIPSNDVSS